MQINGPGPIQGSQPVSTTQRAHGAEGSPRRPHFLEADQLDISREADLISRTRETGETGMDRVAEIRSQIEAGTYETPEKLEAAVDRLLDELA